MNWKDLPMLQNRFFYGVGVVFTTATIVLFLLSIIAFRNGMNKYGAIVIDAFCWILLLEFGISIAFTFYEIQKKKTEELKYGKKDK